MLDYKDISPKQIKLGILIATTILTLGSATYEFYKLKTSYAAIQQNQIQTFETLWNSVWDSNKKLFNDKLDNTSIKKLEELVSTPNEKAKLDLAKLSLPLVQVNFNTSNLTQIVNASSNYYQNEDKDDHYKEQETFNKEVLQKIEDLIKQLNENNQHVQVEAEQFKFDQTLTEGFELKLIKTELKWSELDAFNKNVKDINFLIQRQVEENQNKDKEQEIIDLKSKLDAFIKSATDYQAKIKSDYMTIKEFKDLINEIYAVKIEPNYFDKLKELDFKNQTQTYTVFFTNEFFEKSSTAKKYKDYLNKIAINVNLTAKLTKVNKKENESKSQTLDWSNKMDVAANDSDLMNIHSLSNLKFTIDQKQELKQFVEEKPRESTTSSSSSSTNQPSPTQPNRNTERN
jgi:hypothetical protein